LRLEVTRGYWALVTARAAERVLTRSLAGLDAHVADLRVRLEQGLIPPNEVLSAQAQRSRQNLLAIETANAAAIAEADLQALLGIDPGTRIEIAATLAAPASGAPPAADLVAAAQRQRPEHAALERRTDAARERERAAASASRPTLAVSSGFDVARPNPHIFPRQGAWRDSWDASINLTWPIWDGGRRTAAVAEAAAQVSAAGARLREFDRLVASEVRRRLVEADSSRAAIAAAEDGVVSAAEARRVVGERYNAGVATSTDVLDAEVALLQAELDRTRALAAARLADANLERALGRP
jgi:outer membrane protein TolC